ncbi:DUF3421 domain containing protein, partial [Asbolus verrucosus]
MFLRIFSFVATLAITQAASAPEDHYWRDYDGAIPEDALHGGESSNGRKFYIGQAYVRNKGLIVVQIHPGVKTVNAVFEDKVEKVDAHIKILCGNPNESHWLPTNSTDIQMMLVDYNAVVGGHEDGLGPLHIGRLMYRGEDSIGKITSYKPYGANLYFDDRGEVQVFTTYEVLVHDYYWRDYTGTIPEDAVVGGKDVNGKDIYIGQAYIKNEGLIVVQIYPGVREVQAPIKGIKNVKKYTKVVLITVSALQEDYTWREYTGSIPPDAVVGGEDINGKHIYIGQAYVRNEGLIVVQIYPGVRAVSAPIKGVKKVDTFIKILCGPQENFYWMPATFSDLHLALVGKHAVIGGHEDGGGQLNVGRISHEGEIKIGKITA